MPGNTRDCNAEDHQKLAKLEEARDLLIQALASLEAEIDRMRRRSR